MNPGTPRSAQPLVVAGLAQLMLLLAALASILPWNEATPGPRSAALLGLAVLPIGVVARLRWLSAASLLWGALFLVVELQGWNGGVMRAAGGAGSPPPW